MRVSVVTWQYCDSSCHGIVGVYALAQDARTIVNLLEEHGDSVKRFTIHEIEVIGQAPLILTRDDV